MMMKMIFKKVLVPIVLVVSMVLGSIALDALLCWEAYELVVCQFFYLQPTTYYFWLGMMGTVYVIKRVLVPGTNKENASTNMDLTKSESMTKGIVMIFDRILNYAIIGLVIWIVSII